MLKHQSLYLLLLISATLLSFQQSTRSRAAGNIKTPNIDTTALSGIIIQNGGPQGGLKYTDADGKVYNYAVFWTRINNPTPTPVTINLNIPANAYPVPSLTGQYFKVLIPPDTVNLAKQPLHLYGISNVKALFNKGIHRSASLQRTIAPNASTGFYVVILCLTEGAHGTLRTGLSVKEQNLFYQLKVDGSRSKTPSAETEVEVGRVGF